MAKVKSVTTLYGPAAERRDNITVQSERRRKSQIAKYEDAKEALRRERYSFDEILCENDDDLACPEMTSLLSKMWTHAKVVADHEGHGDANRVLEREYEVELDDVLDCCTGAQCYYHHVRSAR